MHLDVSARFWPKVERLTDALSCWTWLAARFANDYGAFRVGSRQLRATHVAWELAGEPTVAPGKGIYHTCDNHPCVRNDDTGTYEIPGYGVFPRHGHLWIGTHADNMADMTYKQRQAKGITHWSVTQPEKWADLYEDRSKFTPEHVKRGAEHVYRQHPELHARGERTPRAKMTEEKVRSLRRLHMTGKYVLRELAELFGINIASVHNIVTRKHWKHVE